jgi:hypothetical protein
VAGAGRTAAGSFTIHEGAPVSEHQDIASRLAEKVVQAHETGLAGKWYVALCSPDGRIEYASGYDTRGDAEAVCRGIRGVLAAAIRAGIDEALASKG